LPELQIDRESGLTLSCRSPCRRAVQLFFTHARFRLELRFHGDSFCFQLQEVDEVYMGHAYGLATFLIVQQIYSGRTRTPSEEPLNTSARRRVTVHSNSVPGRRISQVIFGGSHDGGVEPEPEPRSTTAPRRPGSST
jgi:hypothetical protein